MDFLRNMMKQVIDRVRLRTGSMELETREFDYNGRIEEGLEIKGNEDEEKTETQEEKIQEGEDMASEQEEDERRDEGIYNIEDHLRYDWLEETDVIYLVERWTGEYEKITIERVKESLRNLLEDNNKPDIMKWLETSHELEVFCDAAVMAGRDVIDFDIEVREILDAVWILMENNENQEDEEEEVNDGEDDELEHLMLGEGEEGPEYYQVRL